MLVTSLAQAKLKMAIMTQLSGLTLEVFLLSGLQDLSFNGNISKLMKRMKWNSMMMMIRNAVASE